MLFDIDDIRELLKEDKIKWNGHILTREKIKQKFL